MKFTGLVTHLGIDFDVPVMNSYFNRSRKWFTRHARCLAGAALCLASASLYGASYMTIVGTYTSEKSKGIYGFSFNSETGAAGPVKLLIESDNPSFVALHPNGRFLYAVNEVTEFQGEAAGAVSAYRIADGQLTFINQRSTGGGAPCHLNVDALGNYLAIANYVGGNTAVFRIDPEGGLGGRTELVQHLGSSKNLNRQSGPHAHSVNFSADNRFLVAADLGADKVFSYPIDLKTGRLDLGRTRSVSLPPGSGPRHFSFHPSSPLAFVNSELTSEVSSLRYDKASGRFTVIDSASTLPRGFRGGNSTAETLVHPNGRFVYVSNRGHNSIAVFRVEASGKLTSVEFESTQGSTPRNFNFDPTGNFLLAANQASDSVVVFRVNQATGELSPTGTTVSVPTPVCLRFLNRQ